MATFRCMVSKDTTDQHTGAVLGTTTTSVFTLANTPIVAGSLSGTVYIGTTPVNTFSVNASGVFSISNVGSPSTFITAGAINLHLGTITLTWNSAPGVNSCHVTYVGTPAYRDISKRLFYVSCPAINQLCNAASNGYVAAVTVCDQHLF